MGQKKVCVLVKRPHSSVLWGYYSFWRKGERRSVLVSGVTVERVRMYTSQVCLLFPGLKQPSPRSQRSLASSTSSGNISGIPQRPGSTTPGQTPPTVRRQNVPPPRSASVDPDVMAERTAAAELKRPDSAR